MSSTLAESNVVQVAWRDADGVVVVTPRNQDRFTIQLKRAVAVLQKADEEAKFNAQFHLLLRLLAEWLNKDSKRQVRNAYLTLRDGALAFVVVRAEAAYDEAFEDELSDLDFWIANDPDLDLIRLNVIALPPASDETLNTFLDHRCLFRYLPADAERA